MRKKLMVATAMLMAGSLFAAGCAQQGAAEGESSSTEVQYQNSIEEAEAYLDGVNERQDELNKEYAPEIRTLEDGTKVQRTPTEYQCYHWNRPYEGGTSYNNYYLDADNRGCGACHEDLGDALTDQLDDRALRLKTLGNAVCPPQAYPIFHYISLIETGACASICPYGGGDG